MQESIKPHGLLRLYGTTKVVPFQNLTFTAGSKDKWA